KDAPSEAMKRLLDRHNGDVVPYLAETDLAFDYLRAFLPLELHLAYQSAIQRSKGSADFITRYPELWRTMLDKAVTNMASLDYMLMTERFTDSIKLLGARIGKPVPQIERHRVGSIPDNVHTNIERLRPELEAAQSNAYALMQVVTAKFKRQMEGLHAVA
ncbi:MAG: hypothetical protein AAFR74_06890, partial [Pseudomonadota bacterium]